MKFNFIVKEINKYTAAELVQKYHYSPVMPRLTKTYLGFFLNNELVGVMTFGWGTQPLGTLNHLFKGLGLTTKDYYELGKMVMDDKMGKNSESQMISSAIKWLKINHPEKMFLYTLADGIVSKAGYVYQSANFLYGSYFWTDVYIGNDGEKIHPRTAKGLCKENAKFLGKEKVFWLTRDFMKTKGITRIRGKMFRYIMPLSKKAQKLLASSSVKWIMNDYPKDKDLEWKIQTDDGYIVTKEMPKMNLSAVNINKKNVDSFKRVENEFFG